MVGDAIMGGLAKVMGAGQQDPAKVQAANQKKIDDVAKRALPLWMAKQAQIAQALGNPNMDEELEAWIEQNMLQGRLHVEDLDPAYQSKIKSQIKLVNTTTDMNQKRAEFSKLIAAAMLARPARTNVGRVAGRIDARAVVNQAMSYLGAGLSTAQLQAIGRNLKAQGINNIPETTIADMARNDAGDVKNMITTMGLTVT